MTVKTQSLKFCQLTVVLVLHKCKSRNEMLRNVTIPENRNRTPRPRAWSCENKWRHFCYPIIIGGFGLAERAQHSTLGCKDKNDVTMLDLIWQSPTLRYRWSLACSDIIRVHTRCWTLIFLKLNIRSRCISPWSLNLQPWYWRHEM